MKKFYSMIVLLSFLFLVACSDETTDNESKDKTNIEMIEVSIDTPQEIKTNEKISIEASVTQGDEKVGDADEVVFEIRKSGSDKSEMVNAENQGSGVYQIEKEFQEEGTFFVTAHVTARDMHNMPSEKIVVGDVSQSVAAENHSHSTSYTVFSFQNENKVYRVNDEVKLSTNVEYGNKALSNAKVLFEISEKDSDESQFITATENEDGQYSAKNTFDTPGTYNINIHVEKRDIHEHYQSEVMVY